MSGGETKDRIAGGLPGGAKRAARGAARAFGAATAFLRVLPDFLIIGAQRGGTTSLYNHLIRHPQISGALLDKEVHYFDKHFARGERWYRSRFPTRIHAAVVRRRTGGAQLVGEASPYYLFNPLVAPRVAAALPDGRFIAMLRDPVERAWSQYRHEVDLGFETLSFEDALDREAERLAGETERMAADPSYVGFSHQHHSYVARGAYADQLEAWFAWVPRERILVLRSEDLYADPAQAYAQTLAFLGATPWAPGGFRRYNAATSTGMAQATRQRLRDHFRPLNEQLAVLLDRDLGWDT